MKKFVYYISAIILLASCSYSGVVISENELPEEIFYLSDQIKPYTGRCVMYFTNTEIIKQEMTFKDGKLNGTMLTYHRNGNIKRKGEYKDGLYNGKWELWTQNGKKLYEVHYKKDTLCGNFMLWTV